MPQTETMMTRPIPSTGEALPVIGCGTYIGFDEQPGTAAFRQLPAVLDELFAAGGTVIDSSPMYGRSEAVTGDLLAAASIATKPLSRPRSGLRARAAGIAQMEQSFAGYAPTAST